MFSPFFCISNKLYDVHIILLGYLAALCPLCLVFFSWVCVELHDRNFWPLVLLWKPFHRCVRLHEGLQKWSHWCFCLVLSSGLQQDPLSVTTLGWECYFHWIRKWRKILYTKCFDLSISCGDVQHLKVTILATTIFVVFNLLPGLLLIFYPIKAFWVCLSRCRLNGIAISYTICQAISWCYRDGLNGGRDMRSLSGL